MKTAMGWRPAIWRRFMAFPDTSSMQCFPCMIEIIKMAPFPSLRHHNYTHLFSHFFHWLYAGSIQMVVVLSSLDEFVLLDLSFHNLSGGDKVVISAVHLIVSPGSCCVWGHMPEIQNRLWYVLTRLSIKPVTIKSIRFFSFWELTWDTGSKLVRELRDEVVVDAIFHRSEHNDRPRVVNCSTAITRVM